jgi:hypothetical protein
MQPFGQERRRESGPRPKLSRTSGHLVAAGSANIHFCFKPRRTRSGTPRLSPRRRQTRSSRSNPEVEVDDRITRSESQGRGGPRRVALAIRGRGGTLRLPCLPHQRPDVQRFAGQPSARRARGGRHRTRLPATADEPRTAGVTAVPRPDPHRSPSSVHDGTRPRPAPRRRPAGLVWHGARRIFAFAPRIRNGIPTNEVERYLHTQAWLTDASRLLDTTPGALVAELIETMLRSGAITLRDKQLHATAEHTPVTAESLQVPFPRAWPPATSTITQAAELQ